MKKKNPTALWCALAYLFAAAVALPVLTLPLLALFPSENIWPHLYRTVLPRYLTTTFLLLLGVGLFSFVVGVASAWLVTMCRFPGRRFFEWSLLLPIAMPAFVIAYVYTDLLEFAGPVQSTLRELMGWRSAREYWFPEIRSLGGAILMMGLVLYPYVYITARSAFLDQSRDTLDAARTLGCSPWRAFMRVALPTARPAITVGLSLALMETLNDFGTVDFFGVQTLSAGIYDVWLSMSNLGGAAQIATVMLTFVVVLLVIERGSRRRERYFDIHRRGRPAFTYHLQGWRGYAAAALCATAVGLGFALPAAVLVQYSVQYFHESWTPEFRRFAWNSVSLAAGAAVLTLAVGGLFAYARRLRASRWLRWATGTASLGYAIPGAVLAIGIIVPLSALDHLVDAWARGWLGISTGLVLSGTTFALLFAYMVRFLTISVGNIEASLGKIAPTMDMAARGLGHGPGLTFLRVHLPLMRSSLLAAAVIVFVDCMKELPATLILRPFNFDTLATHLYQFASDEQIELAALGAVFIVAAGIIPVVVLTRAMNREIGGGHEGPAARSRPQGRLGVRRADAPFMETTSARLLPSSAQRRSLAASRERQ